jgi:hypothetical protein
MDINGYNYSKIKAIINRFEPKLIKIRPNIIYKQNTHLCYDQVFISIKYNKLQNYKKCVKHLIDLESEVANKILLEELLKEIDSCIDILEPLKLSSPTTITNLSLLDIDLDLDLDLDLEDEVK